MNTRNERTDGTAKGQPIPAHRRILIVEDDQRLAEVIREWFTMLGHQVTVATRGIEALNHVSRVNFDAIICDMVMPQMPGEMFYIAVGKLKPRLSERFVFITGFRDRPDIAAFFQRYNGPALEKPLSMLALSEAVEQVVAGRKKSSVAA